MNKNDRDMLKIRLSDTQFHDLAKSFAKLKIVIDLRNIANENTFFGMAIIRAIDKKENPDLIIAMIKSQIQDNFNGVADCIGFELTERILNF